MSSALAIAAVTSILKSMLDNHLVHSGVTTSVGEVTVSALPPDRISLGTEERSQLNLFMYRLTPHTAWRKVEPSTSGEPPTGRRLALDLHYLITAYGEQDYHAEILLGHAVQLLLDTPLLTQDAVRSALSNGHAGNGSVFSSSQAALNGASLGDYVDRLEIVPEFLSSEETSKLWSSLQARYRPSAAYKVSSVVMESSR